MKDLMPHEREVLDLLGEAATAYGQLPAVHPSDQGDFVRAIHAAQNIVLARPATEQLARERIAARGLAPPDRDTSMRWGSG